MLIFRLEKTHNSRVSLRSGSLQQHVRARPEARARVRDDDGVQQCRLF